MQDLKKVFSRIFIYARLYTYCMGNNKLYIKCCNERIENNILSKKNPSLFFFLIYFDFKRLKKPLK